jgi:hypothetical protein
MQQSGDRQSIEERSAESFAVKRENIIFLVKADLSKK